MFKLRRRNSLSIGTKTLISHITLALFVILLASVLSYMLTFHYVRDNMIDDLVSKARHVATSSRVNAEGSFIPGWRTVEIYRNLTNSEVFYLDMDSQNIRMRRYYNDTPGDESDDFRNVDIADSLEKQFVNRIMSGETVSAMRQFGFSEGVILFAGVPIMDDMQVVQGGVILAQPVEHLNKLSRGIRVMLTSVVGISLLLAIILALEQTRMLVRPIQRMTQAARRMADGFYAERVSPLPDNEIGDLGRTLNVMSSRLVDTIESLKDERNKLEKVIAGIGEGIVAVDRNMNVIHYNRAFLELMEIECIENVEGEIEGCLLDLKNLVEGSLSGTGNREMVWDNPSGRALSALASPILNDDGKAWGAVCLIRDVSQEQRMEQLRRDYVANISHELRTPLTGIRGMVEPLIDGYIDTEEEKQNFYRIIHKETIRLEKLVGEMLDMSRLQDGRLSVELEKLEIPGILQAAVGSVQAIADEAGIVLTVETDGTPLACMGNENRIMQVLVILLDNALSFTPSGGSITVHAKDMGDHVAVSVRDTGCGIEPKDLPLIFERFYKVDRSRMRTTGTGLGLSIAKLVVELMGGRITVESEPGKGAEFTFTLQK
ncbi:MAG: HAMP domain-containing protein [Clostridiales bacterium]|nr:HAMP domain-containing protein [Clostridiales bacterium]